MKRSFIILAVLTTAFLALPFIGLFQRVPWSELNNLLTSDTTLDALRVSLTVSLISTIIVFSLGTPLSLIHI